MSILVACLDIEDRAYERLERIISSKLFTDIVLVGAQDTFRDYHVPKIIGVGTYVMAIDSSKPVEDIVSDLYVWIKQRFSKEKIQELDIAVNISSGSGKMHAVIISTLMKLGYGIRLIELDKDGNILEMI